MPGICRICLSLRRCRKRKIFRIHHISICIREAFKMKRIFLLILCRDIADKDTEELEIPHQLHRGKRIVARFSLISDRTCNFFVDRLAELQNNASTEIAVNHIHFSIHFVHCIDRERSFFQLRLLHLRINRLKIRSFSIRHIQNRLHKRFCIRLHGEKLI